MPKPILWAIALGLFVLAVAFLMPTMIDATTEDTTQSVILETGQDYDLTDELRVRLDNISTDVNVTDKVTISYIETDSYDSSQATINDTENDTLYLDGDNITADVAIRDSDTALITSTYPPLFGWNDGARAFVTNMEIVILLVGIIMILGLLWVHI